MIRLFIALTISDDVKTKLGKIIQHLQSKNSDVKWVTPNNLHLTIKFIGNCDQAQVSGIITQLEQAASVHSPVQSSFTGLGGFPSLEKPKVIWIDIEKNREQIISLAKDVDQSLTMIGFEKDSKLFKPHLTLGRVKKDIKSVGSMSFLKEIKRADIDTCFDSLELIHSTLTQRGPIYKTLHKISLNETFGG